MHIPDGLLDVNILVTTAVISAAAVGYGVKKANKNLGEKQVPLLGLTAAFIFAAQMLNFPVAGGTSGHFLGALFAAVLLGPWVSCLIMTVVLVVQCLIFADGGLTALGANVFNMGVIGGILCYYFFTGLKSILPKSKPFFISAVAVSSWLSVVLASSACAVELAISGRFPLNVGLPAMAGVHMLIGIGEAVIASTVVSVILAARPDLVQTYSIAPSSLGGVSRGVQ